MNTQLRSHYPGASALQITRSAALSFACAILLVSVHAAVAEFAAAPKPAEVQKSAPMEFSTSRERVGGREIAEFSARQVRVAPLLIDPSWITTGSLATARAYHTATLLSNGRVLVAGGLNVFDALASAELYDPASGTWSATSSLATARWFPTATLLQNGKVLVAGGYDRFALPLASAELYDPASGTWSATGSLATAREGHTATLLPNGKVLVAGGSGGGLLVSAELYDPASGTWTTTDSLAIARAVHTATLLPTGQVLVAGGTSNSGVSSSAELYDPATGSWSSTGSLGTARYYHTATLLPLGKVLVAGGWDGHSVTISTAELYDPGTGSWRSTGSLGTARRGHTATLLPSGEALVAGGYNGEWLNSAELYDLASESWSSTASMGTDRWFHTATLLPSGEVLVAGGDNGSGSLSSAELFDPATVSQITPRGTSCSQFASGTAETLGSVEYSVKNGLIDRVAPNGLLYWLEVTAAAGDNAFTIDQTITSGNFNTLLADRGNGSNVLDSDCVSLEATGRHSGGTVTVRFNAPAAGTYFIAIGFDAKSLIGTAAPSPGTTVHFVFTTNGVPHSTSELDLVEH